MTRHRKVLVVDDDRNTRTALEQALEPLGYEIVLAVSGEQALERILEPGIELVLLDMRMPGVDGLAVLRRIEEDRPDIRVIVITAHGTVDSAVESMKHGALDVVQKPLSLERIRAIVHREMDLDERREATREGYDTQIRQARDSIRSGKLDIALAHLRRAEAIDRERPEAFNLIGVVLEARHQLTEAQKHYRVALEVDRTYAAARRNLERSTAPALRRGPPVLGDEDDD